MKKRLDLILTERGLFPSREQAHTAIMTGRILVAGQKQVKAGTMIDENAPVEVLGHDCPFVSRGGLKLQKAVECFGLTMAGWIMADIGASTGGFTDCALQHGAARVYAVDVGYGQLAWALRQDSRVITLEKTNARYLTTAEIPEPLDIITADVSFISLEKIVPALLPLLKADGRMVLLIKPQFEAGREKVGKKGVVRDPAIHEEVILRLVDFFEALGLAVNGLEYSPIRGPEGNREYLVLLARGSVKLNRARIPQIVDAAFQELT